MKPSREEVLKCLEASGFNGFITMKNIERFAAAMYEAGAAAERAVSDRLLTTVKEAVAGMGGSYGIWSKPAIALIAEVEAMRKEQK